jgi:hypothetical protein
MLREGVVFDYVPFSNQEWEFPPCSKTVFSCSLTAGRHVECTRNSTNLTQASGLGFSLFWDVTQRMLVVEGRLGTACRLRNVHERLTYLA